jgi:hypothetical protein
VGINFVPSPFPNSGIPRGESGIGSPLPSLDEAQLGMNRWSQRDRHPSGRRRRDTRRGPGGRQGDPAARACGGARLADRRLSHPESPQSQALLEMPIEQVEMLGCHVQHVPEKKQILTRYTNTHTVETKS